MQTVKMLTTKQFEQWLQQQAQIAIRYRQIEKSDGAVIGSLLNQNAEINFSNLLSAVRTKKAKHTDVLVDDNLGTVSEVSKNGRSISDQIESGIAKIRVALLAAKSKKTLDDVLKVDIDKLIKQNKNEKIKTAKIVANLPYYITTPIIMKLLEDKLDIQSITVMIQKEVADRLIEIPGGKDTGAITYSVYYYCKSEKIMEVPNSSFIPEPEVTSEVIKLNLRKSSPVEVNDMKKMFSFVTLKVRIIFG